MNTSSKSSRESAATMSSSCTMWGAPRQHFSTDTSRRRRFSSTSVALVIFTRLIATCARGGGQGRVKAGPWQVRAGQGPRRPAALALPRQQQNAGPSARHSPWLQWSSLWPLPPPRSCHGPGSPCHESCTGAHTASSVGCSGLASRCEELEVRHLQLRVVARHWAQRS